MTEDRYRVQSVERAFALLEALAEAGPDGMTLSSLARLLGVSKSTAYAILQTLLAGGFVADAGAGMSRRYRLGMALARLGDVVVSQIALRDVAMPVIRDLTAETGLTSRLAVLDDAHAIVIARVDAPQSTVRFTASLGKREHLHCSAVGKSMLAALPAATVHEIVAAAGLPGEDAAHDHRRVRAAGRAGRGRRGARTRSTTRRTPRASSASGPRSSTTPSTASARSASPG